MTLKNRTILIKYNVLRALALYNACSLEDLAEVLLRPPVILAFRRPCDGNLGGLRLRPLYLLSGEGHPGTFYAG